LPNDAERGTHAIRAGIFGIALTACLMLVASGYTKLPFFPQGKSYVAYFADTGGVVPGNDVNVSGITVGHVSSTDLAGDRVKVTFTAERHIKVGDQSLAAIKTDTILGQKSLALSPRGFGSTTTIPLDRTTTPYTLNAALQDLGRNAGDLDKQQFADALGVLTDALQSATPQLRGTLEGVTSLSATLNGRDQALTELLQHAKSVTDVLAHRAGQVNQLVVDGNRLFGSLDQRRQALASLIAGIGPVSQQISGFVADNRTEFGPALTKLNAVLDNLNERRDHISAALKQLPGYSTTLGEVVASGPGFNVNVYGLPPPQIAEVLLDTYFQPGKLPASLADYIKGMIQERMIIRPKSP
jgi:phospholipid/cholesterol/gamma-HCH transport system substrate-binding protein